MNDAILDWSSTDNCILVDQNTGDYKLQNRTRGDLRLFIGDLTDTDFTLTVNSIQELDSTSQKKIRRELKHVSDERIIEGCKNGDPSSYKALYEKYGRLLQWTAFKIVQNTEDAEDLLQDALISIFKGIHNFRNQGSFEGWLKRIVVNHALNHIKIKKRYDFFTDIDYLNEIAEDVYEDIYSDIIAREDLLQMISELADGHRTVFGMTVIGEQPYEIVAKKLKTTKGTISSQTHKAKAKLQKKILQKLNKQNLSF